MAHEGDSVNENDDDQALPAALMEELMSGLRAQAPPPDRAAALRARVMGALRDTPQEDSELSLAIAAWRSLTPLADARWEERWPGIELCMLRESEGARAYLMRMRPGAVLPAHAHTQTELSLILEGDAQIAGRALGPGDFDLMPAGADHAEIRSIDGCIAFIHGERGFRPKLTAALVAGLARLALQRFTR